MLDGVARDGGAPPLAGASVSSLRRLGRLTPWQWRALAAELPTRRPAPEGEALALLAAATRALRDAPA